MSRPPTGAFATMAAAVRQARRGVGAVLLLAACNAPPRDGAAAGGPNPPAGQAHAAPVHLMLSAQDGAVVAADVYGTGERGVVLAHGGRLTRESWATQARVLADSGFRVMAIDFRGFGMSQAPPNAKKGDDDYRYDVLAAVQYLRTSGAKTVAVVGASFGGDATAEALIEAKPNEIDRVVLLAGGAYAPPKKLVGRKLYIMARDDANSEGRRLPRFQKAYDAAPNPKELLIVEGSAHAQFIFGTDQGERVMRAIVRFLSAP